jgi:hypothetical protein
MLRRCGLFRAEFEKEVKKAVKLPSGGAPPDKRHRFFHKWKQNVLRQTNDLNRLADKPRYADLVNRLALTEKQAPLRNDLRTDDHRRVRWRCETCNQRYLKSVKATIHHGRRRCAKCESFSMHGLASPEQKPLAKDVLKKGELGPTLASKLPAASRSMMRFTCKQCSKKYRAPVRCKTNAVMGAHNLMNDVDAHTAYDHCPQCRQQAFASRSKDFLASLRA